MKFYLGTNHLSWAAKCDVPLFYSFRKVGKRAMGAAPLKRAQTSWALDSGGFAEISEYGRWTLSEDRYAAGVQRLARRLGSMDFACPQDWICSPAAVERSGLSVSEHQRRTVESLLGLRSAAPDVTWVPVLQGWKPSDYRAHVELYSALGVELRDEQLVAIGSIAARQDDPTIAQTIHWLAGHGIRLHGLGVKTIGLKTFGDSLATADSYAWFQAAREFSGPALPECREARRVNRHPKRCVDCLKFAMVWRERVMEASAERHDAQAAESLFESNGAVDFDQLDRVQHDKVKPSREGNRERREQWLSMDL